MKLPLHQRASNIFLIILGGFLALGAVLGSVVDASSLVTPLAATIGTAVIVLVWLLAHIILPKRPLPWVFGTQRMQVKKLGIQSTAFAAGMVLLLWVPLVSRLVQHTFFPPSQDAPPLVYSISEPSLFTYPPGTKITNEVEWKEGYRSYLFSVVNPSKTENVVDVRLQLQFPWSMLSLEFLRQEGCEGLMLAENEGKNSKKILLVDREVVQGAIGYKTNTININVLSMHPEAFFDGRIILDPLRS